MSGRAGVFSSNVFRGGERDIRKLLLYSLVFHLLLILAFTIFSSSEEEEAPRERVVRLVLKKRVVSKAIVPDRPKNSASGIAKKALDSVFDKSFFRKIRHTMTLDRSRVTDDAPKDPVSSRDRGLDRKYDRLQKSPSADHGRLNRSTSKNIDDYPGRRDLNKDTRTRDGNRHSLGRDGLTRNMDNRDPLRDAGSRRATRGNRGTGTGARLFAMGRWIVYKPHLSLPARYSRQGISHRVRLQLEMTPEGLIQSASIVGVSGDAGLRRLLVQWARRIRLNTVSGSGVKIGTLVITINPR